MSRLLALPLLFGIWIYRSAISQWLPRVCVFQPSCSNYARLAILRHGVIKGVRLTVQRLQKCEGGEFQGIDLPPDC